MAVPWTELFHNKGSVYALDEATKEWVHRGTSGVVIMLQSTSDPDDVRVKFEGKNELIIWWRLTSSKLKPKGARALVLKAWSVGLNQQEILAIRFSAQTVAILFAKKYHKIYPMSISENIQIEQIFQQKGGSNANLHDKNIENENVRNNGAKPNGASASMASLPDNMMEAAQNGFNNNYGYGAQQRNHRMSGPPPAPSRHKKPPPPLHGDYGLDDDNVNMMRHYSEPLPVQPQINHKRMVKALPDMKPPTFNHLPSSWKCAVCTYQNQCAVDKCGMCGLPLHGKDDGVDKDKNKWCCSACTFKNHEWMDRCEVCSAVRRLVTEAVFDNLQNKDEAMLLHKQMRDQIEFEDDDVDMNPAWNCPICTLLNEGTATRCSACNTQRSLNNVKDEFKDSFNEYDDPLQESYNQFEPQPLWDNHWERMMNTGMGVSGNPFNIFEVDEYNGFFESTVEDFSRAASDIACYNGSPSSVFSTLRSVAKKLLKEDPRYRTLDTTNPKVMERLIGFEGVLDFLMLLGFESDAMGMKLICLNKPSRAKVNNAISVLNSYQQRFRMTDNGMNEIPENIMSIPDDFDDINDDLLIRTKGFDPAMEPEAANDILTLEQIILWSTHENMQDNDTMETLVMTHKLFTDSLTLLKQLRKRFFVPIPEDVDNILEFQNGVQKRIQLKVIKALRDWMKHYWFEDFDQNTLVENELQEWLKELSVYNELDIHNINCIWISKLYTAVKKEYLRLKQMDWNQILDKKLDILGRYKAIDSMEIKLNKCTSEEIADQITLMDYKLFSSIEPRECVHQRWKDSNNKREAPNILSLIQQFNNFTIFIQIQILKERSLKKRATAIKRIVKMGQHFKMTRNYNSLCAVFSALNSAPIHRLKIAWNRVQEKTRIAFQEWSFIFCRDFNHRNLRQLLRKAGGNPCIPHIGVFLQDLVFIDEGNKKKIELESFNGNKMLNFNKCVRIADRIKNLQLFQNHKYDTKIEENLKIQKILLIEFDKLKDTTEDQIWDMSTKVKQDDQTEAKQPLGFFNYNKPNDMKPNEIPPVQSNEIKENILPI